MTKLTNPTNEQELRAILEAHHCVVTEKLGDECVKALAAHTNAEIAKSSEGLEQLKKPRPANGSQRNGTAEGVRRAYNQGVDDAVAKLKENV